jgi:hypothetical protein
MSEPIVTIKFTETELKTLNEMIKHHPDSVIPQHKRVLKEELIKIEKWIADEKHKAVTDKKASEESFKEQTQMETSKRICVPCDD